MNIRGRVRARTIGVVVVAATVVVRSLLPVAGLLAAGCLVSPPPRGPHEVRYRLTWDRDGVAPAPDGGWDVVNDLGYRVHVTRGWVTSYSMELVECPKEPTGTPHASNAASWLLAADAWAGHLAGTPNPAAIRPMQVESLTAPEPHDAGAVTLAPQPYCKLHYLVARAGHDSPGLPSELDMVDTTLHLEGTVRAPGASTEAPLTVHTASAYGQLFEREGNAAVDLHADPGDGAIRVEVRRHLARMFDGVDFSRMPERAIALQILKALVDHTDVAIVPLDAKH